MGPDSTGLRVVVIDNDSAALDLAVTDLGLEGHEIVGTGMDGDTALRLCEELEPDVLVVDHRMPPGPWGIDVAAKLRASQPGIRVVIYSNYQSPDLVNRAADLGVTLLLKGNLRALRRVVAG